MRLFLLGLLAVAACTPKPETAQQADARIATQSADAKKVIDSLNADFEGHFNAGHGDLVAAQYTEDGELLVSNEPVAKGRAAIAAMVNSMATMKAAVKFSNVTVVADGNLAIERGDYTMSLVPPGAPAAVSDTGPYLIHWHKVNGNWMRVSDAAVSLTPMPEPAAPKK